jgi:quercetin dioxygenase-like cupin family protein
MASPSLEFDLTAETDRLHRETTWNTGQNALKASARIPGHKANGRISVHVLSGHVRLNAAGRTFDLLPGSVLALDKGAPHDLEALQESAVLLTIAWAGGYSRTEAVGQTALGLGLWADPSRRVELLQLLNERGTAEDFEARARTKSGDNLDLLVWMARI